MYSPTNKEINNIVRLATNKKKHIRRGTRYIKLQTTLHIKSTKA